MPRPRYSNPWKLPAKSCGKVRLLSRPALILTPALPLPSIEKVVKWNLKHRPKFTTLINEGQNITRKPFAFRLSLHSTVRLYWPAVLRAITLSHLIECLQRKIKNPRPLRLQRLIQP